MAGIFKAYDIRGIYGDTLTDDIAEEIGRAFVTLLGCRRVVIGRDMRPHSEPVFAALAKGITALGADVIDLGLCSTPMCYHAVGSLEGDAGIMVTASHNPGEWTGMKLCRAGVVPISNKTGILDIERIIDERSFAPESHQPGAVTTVDHLPAYTEHVHKLADIRRPIRIAVDFANAMGIVEAKALDGLVEIDGLFDTLDGSFPNHEANPLKTETLADLQAMIRQGSYDFGVAFDGDADRAGIVDEKGEIVPMDIVTALIAQTILAEKKGAILYDVRSSWAVREVIEENGGRPVMSRVGHAFIKQLMRDEDAIFAGEVSGHYYFQENYFTESMAMAVVFIAGLVSRSDQPLSALVAPIRRYFSSGEINREVADTAAVLAAVMDVYGSQGKVTKLDGVSVEFDDWWFNVRASNTEPLVRLNLEAKTPELMAAKRDEVLKLMETQ